MHPPGPARSDQRDAGSRSTRGDTEPALAHAPPPATKVTAESFGRWTRFVGTCSPRRVWISYTQMVGSTSLPSNNSSANCGWRTATFKFHLLLFCHLLYSETHSSESQACWDTDKFYHLWLVTSIRLVYFNTNSLPNLILIN